MADIATSEARLPTSGPVLLGTFGADTAPSALLRLPNGEILRADQGDNTPAGTILGIAHDHVILTRHGRVKTLSMPR